MHSGSTKTSHIYLGQLSWCTHLWIYALVFTTANDKRICNVTEENDKIISRITYCHWLPWQKEKETLSKYKQIYQFEPYFSAFIFNIWKSDEPLYK